MGSHDLFRRSREAGIQYVNYAKRKHALLDQQKNSFMPSNLQQFSEKALADSNVRDAYDKLAEEFAALDTEINAQKEQAHHHRLRALRPNADRNDGAHLGAHHISVEKKK
jgi:hypothetical protein